MKSTTERTTVTADQIPPYCYRLPGMTAEEGAAIAVKALQITHLCDALALLWELRRVASKAQTNDESGGMCIPAKQNAAASDCANLRPEKWGVQ